MQDRYTGDIGDFGKYGLLRALTAPETGGPPELGVVWCLTPDETGSQDGKHTGYLHLKEREKNRFANCDEELYLALQGLVDSGSRSVKAVQKSGILPDGTAYHDTALDLRKPEKKPGETVRQARDRERTEWREAALETTEGCQLVFLDPDNGLETPSVRPHTVRGAKYVYYEDLDPYLKRGQSLVIYHHLNRGRRSLDQIYRRQREIYEKLGSRALAMRYHRGSPRAFILIPQGGLRKGLMDRTRRMLAGPWSSHFTMIG